MLIILILEIILQSDVYPITLYTLNVYSYVCESLLNKVKNNI